MPYANNEGVRIRYEVEARMRVPKMVKNGLNSVLPISPVFGKDKTPKKSRTDTKPKAAPRP
jgi:hypothetical protein